MLNPYIDTTLFFDKFSAHGGSDRVAITEYIVLEIWEGSIPRYFYVFQSG